MDMGVYLGTYHILQFNKLFLFPATSRNFSSQFSSCFPKVLTKMDLIRSLFFEAEKKSLTSLPSDCQFISSKLCTPPSQQLINSLLHWPEQQAAHLQRESLKQLCHHLARQSYSEFECVTIQFFLLFLFNSLSLLSRWFINNCSAVKTQFINCSQRKAKLRQGARIFCCRYVFFSRAGAGR